MEQPNAVGDGPAVLSIRFWIALVLTGIATGLMGDLMMVVLFNTQHWVYGYHTGSAQAAAFRASAWHRVIALTAGGAFGGVAWFFLRKYTKGEKAEIDDVLWSPEGGELSVRRSFGTSVISEVVVGAGGSVGREAAPKLMGGVSGSVLGKWFGLTPEQRRLLIACGGGSGLAAVYNVPLGGALFTAEILYGSLTLPVAIPALACSSIATLTAYIYLPTHATYVGVPSFHFNTSILIWSLIAGPIIGLFATLYIRLMGFISHHRVKGVWTIPATTVAFGILGVIGIAYPELFGNGKDMAHMVFLGHSNHVQLTIWLLFALFMLKPLVTAMCLGSGASGGLFTPFLSTGAVMGAFGGLLWTHLFPGSPIGAFALIGAAAMLGSSMQAPLAGLVLVLELTQNSFGIMIPIILATVLATAVARHIDGYSIYSARLPGTGE
jgi:H+/Cl- antiporter ClcA